MGVISDVVHASTVRKDLDEQFLQLSPKFLKKFNQVISKDTSSTKVQFKLKNCYQLNQQEYQKLLSDILSNNGYENVSVDAKQLQYNKANIPLFFFDLEKEKFEWENVLFYLFVFPLIWDIVVTPVALADTFIRFIKRKTSKKSCKITVNFVLPKSTLSK